MFAWFCLISLGVACVFLVLLGVASFCLVLLVFSWFCSVLLGVASFRSVLRVISWFCLVLLHFVWFCLCFLGFAWFCLVLLWASLWQGPGLSPLGPRGPWGQRNPQGFPWALGAPGEQRNPQCRAPGTLGAPGDRDRLG